MSRKLSRPLGLKPHRLTVLVIGWGQNPIQLPLPHSLTLSLSPSLLSANSNS